MKLRILGSATSIGVPVIGCDCPVCTSEDRRNFRTRTSAVFEENGRSLLVDTSTDLRLQALWFDLDRVDAVVLTHAHADHIGGLDDLRSFNFRQGDDIPVFGNAATIDQVRTRFGYIFETTQIGGGKPMVNLHTVDGPFEAAGFSVQPVWLKHGALDIFGFRVGDAAYCTDVSEIPEASYALLEGLEVLVIDALRYKAHPTHFSLDQALGEIRRIRPRRAVLTHLTHVFDHAELAASLPDAVEPAYDGLVIDL